MKKFKDEAERKEYFRQKQADRRAVKKGADANVKPREKTFAESWPTVAAIAEKQKSALTDVPLSVYADGDIMTETDRQFEAKHPGYYVFEKVERDVQCHFCHKKFRTRMMLLRFCSPECQHEKLKSFSTVGMLAGKEN